VTVGTSEPLVILDRKPSPVSSERGTVCADVPAPSDPGLVERARAARATLGDQVTILGHHYQRDEVIAFADARGDSYKLCVYAAEAGAPFVIFLGVHFMAESADILTPPEIQILLPDLAAGCSMADMATAGQVVEAWDVLEQIVPGSVTPITYMNSSAAIKAFTGRNGGAVCTSSNAAKALTWAFAQRERVLFLPDQHLGRNTALAMGYSPDELKVWDPWKDLGGLTEAEIADARVLLWKGHCSVHQRFAPEHVHAVRAKLPGARVIVHPECRHEVVELADEVGSTEHILRTIADSPAGSVWAVGTELNLVSRIAAENPDKTVAFLEDTVCFCATMNRIDLPHLVWIMEELLEGRVQNRIEVDPETARDARLALDRMLQLA
jgi:quinolinate synthase